MPEQNRLADIVERYRAEMRPDLSADLVREVARIQVQFQFAGDDRAAAQKEMREVISAALPLARADEASA